MNASVFGKRLKQLRIEKGLTQEELAKEINQTKANISRYENGKLQPSFETLDFFADYFKVDFNYLLGVAPIPMEEMEKRGITQIDLNEEAEKRGLTSEEVIEIFDTFEALMKKRRSK